LFDSKPFAIFPNPFFIKHDGAESWWLSLTHRGASFKLYPRSRPHRLEAKDIALSRRKPGFESRWGHSLGSPLAPSGGLFLCKKRKRERRPYPRTRERLRKRVRPRSDARPEHDREYEREDYAQGTEN
jgi:hypothetical protein